MRLLFEKAKRVATRDTTVLITGETGVGKERLARWIHGQSRRAQRALVAVNCGALPDTLLDTHLFGHVKGAFTGAVGDSAGLFEAASGGTLFLDEVGEVSPAMQVKLLRVLQEREVQRVGEWRARPVDVRVLTATNRSLDDEVAAGRFRDDLLYRLRVVELRVPPLRERLGELSHLAHEFLARKSGGHLGMTGFSADAWASLLQYRWPGNVRELENVIEEAVAIADGTTVELADLPERIRSGPNAPTRPGARPASGTPLDQLQRSYILGVLRRHGGNQRLAAAELGISLSTLKRRLRGRPSP
jgi:transcriptional regulator with PAS, ATPase and Fis domain